MNEKLTFSNISAFILLLLSLLTFIFGSKIVDTFKESKLVYSSIKVALTFPSDITILNKGNKNKIIPDSYREIKFVNIGSRPSTDLKIQIVIDGEVIDSKVQSIEDFALSQKGRSEIIITMKRLASNAEVNLKIWFKQGVNDLSIKAIDDQGSFRVTNINEIDENNYLEILSFILIVLILLFIFCQWFIRPKNENITDLNIQLEKLQKKYELALNERDELQRHFEDNKRETETDAISILKAFIAKEESN